jgi:hypothetical protein
MHVLDNNDWMLVTRLICRHWLMHRTLRIHSLTHASYSHSHSHSYRIVSYRLALALAGTEVGHEGLLIMVFAIAVLTFVSILIAVHDERINTFTVLMVSD